MLFQLTMLFLYSEPVVQKTDNETSMLIANTYLKWFQLVCKRQQSCEIATAVNSPGFSQKDTEQSIIFND